VISETRSRSSDTTSCSFQSDGGEGGLIAPIATARQTSGPNEGRSVAFQYMKQLAKAWPIMWELLSLEDECC
jgi:hypothetical protein